jgi:hypothetical protein
LRIDDISSGSYPQNMWLKERCIVTNLDLAMYNWAGK